MKSRTGVQHNQQLYIQLYTHLPICTEGAVVVFVLEPSLLLEVTTSEKHKQITRNNDMNVSARN